MCEISLANSPSDEEGLDVKRGPSQVWCQQGRSSVWLPVMDRGTGEVMQHSCQPGELLVALETVTLHIACYHFSLERLFRWEQVKKTEKSFFTNPEKLLQLLSAQLL